MLDKNRVNTSPQHINASDKSHVTDSCLDLQGQIRRVFISEQSG